METPSQVLALKITKRLAEEKLLLADGAQKFSAKLASGKLGTADWRLAVEQTIPAPDASEMEAQA